MSFAALARALAGQAIDQLMPAFTTAGNLSGAPPTHLAASAASRWERDHLGGACPADRLHLSTVDDGQDHALQLDQPTN